MVEYLDAPKKPYEGPASDGLDAVRVTAALSDASVRAAVSHDGVGDSNAPLVSAKLIPPITLVEARVQPGQPQVDGQQSGESQAADALNERIGAQPPERGDKIFTTPEGNQVVTREDGSTVYKNANGRVFGVRYANGDMRTFTYNAKGEIDTVLDNNRLFTVNANGELVGPDGKPTGLKSPQVTKEGTYIVTDSQRGIHFQYSDRRESISQNDGSLLSKDADGRITGVRYWDGTHRFFEYDERGRMNGIIDRDGKRYGFVATFDALGVRFGSFKASNGQTMSDVSLQPDGTFRFEDEDGKLHTDYASGNSEKTTLTVAELRNMAMLMRLTDWAVTSNESIRETVAKLLPSDQVALDRQYKEMFGETLTDHLKAQRWNPLKREAVDATLTMLSEAHLREAVQKAFSDHRDVFAAETQMFDFNQRAARAGLTPEQINAVREKAAAELLKNDKSLKGKLESLEKIFTEAAPTMRALEEKFGVTSTEVVRPDGTRVRRYYVEGENGAKTQVLDTTSDDPKEVERQLTQWREAKIKEIEAKYNLQISRDGQTDRLQGKDAALRTPRVDELLALEQAAMRSQPSARSANGKPVRVEFTARPSTPYDAYVPGRVSDDEQERIVFEPLSRTFQGFKDTAMHEFAHIGQHNMRQRDAAALDRAFEAMGYRKVKTEDGAMQWQLKGKDGNYYTENPNGTGWTRVDEKGRPLKADGKPASGFKDKDAVTISSIEMQERAAVRPASWYFTNPVENQAEGLWLFRGGEQDRTRLFTRSPELYKIIKEYDQKEIDADPRYGKNSDGTAKFIRLPDGNIGENNEANRARVTQFEKKMPLPMTFGTPEVRSPQPWDKETKSPTGTLPRIMPSCPCCANQAG
ncbi:MAG: hypothetical protein U0105_20005 [Candidatus Obscuribacterales bacterium]